jgi:hypothetical protein
VRRGMREKSMLATYRSAVGDWINSRAERYVFQKIGCMFTPTLSTVNARLITGKEV